MLGLGAYMQHLTVTHQVLVGGEVHNRRHGCEGYVLIHLGGATRAHVVLWGDDEGCDTPHGNCL